MITEREFLHEMASPLAAAICGLDSLLADLKERNDGGGIMTEDVGDAFSCLLKLKELMEKRRNEIHRKEGK